MSVLSNKDFVNLVVDPKRLEKDSAICKDINQSYFKVAEIVDVVGLPEFKLSIFSGLKFSGWSTLYVFRNVVMNCIPTVEELMEDYDIILVEKRRK